MVPINQDLITQLPINRDLTIQALKTPIKVMVPNLSHFLHHLVKIVKKQISYTLCQTGGFLTILQRADVITTLWSVKILLRPNGKL